MKKKRPSKGIVIYAALSIVGLILHISGAWDKIFENVSKIGVTSPGALDILDDIFTRLFRATPAIIKTRMIGRLTGGIIGLILTVGIIGLKEWARKTKIVFHCIVLIYVLLNVPHIIGYYAGIFKGKLWLGYYLFGCMLLVSVVSLPIFIYFLTRPKVKAQFKR